MTGPGTHNNGMNSNLNLDLEALFGALWPCSVGGEPNASKTLELKLP